MLRKSHREATWRSMAVIAGFVLSELLPFGGLAS